MFHKVSLYLVILVIFSAVLSGCGQGSSQTQSSINQSTVSALGSKGQISNAAGTSALNTAVSTAATGTTGGKANTTDGTAVNNPAEKPVAAEKNPPGDIPDTQVFVKYTSSAGNYELQTPEGWARTENGANVKFEDKFDGLQVDILDVTGPVALDSISKNQVATLVSTGRAVKVKSIKAVKLSGQQAYVVSYDSNSDPDPVTNKQIRLENQNFYFNKDGKMAVIRVWAPLGADNADQWNYISQNFKWR